MCNMYLRYNSQNIRRELKSKVVIFAELIDSFQLHYHTLAHSGEKTSARANVAMHTLHSCAEDDVRACAQLLHDELVCNVLRIRPRFSFATLHQLIIFDPIQTDLLI